MSEPIGLKLTRISRGVSRAFDESLAEAGGSLATWVVLVSLKARRHTMQREIAADVGIEGPTLTHHLNRMEAAGLVTRTRNPANRRIHNVELTPAGEELFFLLLKTVQAFDQRLRAGLEPAELDRFSTMLDRLSANVSRTQVEETKP
jgi:MarR family transcriptional regulator for hemolysin